MEEDDHEQCAHIFQKIIIKATIKVVGDKTIPQKLIHHTQRTIE
jgi:hypothetical protein